MKSADIRYTVEPRDVPAQKAARRLHLTLREFESHRLALFARGFPEPDPTTGMYDLAEIDRWMDRRHERKVVSGAKTASDALRERLERIANDNDHGTVRHPLRA
jgi:hypothetical protein